MPSRIHLKRVYDAPSATDGCRVLVDRLWPRGLIKENARITLWLKDVAPSTDLRRRFHSGALDWQGFQAAYRCELTGAPWADAVRTLLRLADEGALTLVYAAKDRQCNHAVVLGEHLDTLRTGASHS